MVVQDHKVPSAHIEATQMIDGRFSVVNIFVHDKGCAFGVLVLVA